MGRLFGTDGVRGLANGDLTPQLALSVGEAAARVLIADAPNGERPVAVVGRDGRASGEMLEAAVVAGLTSAGADVLRVGMLPTPAVAFLTAYFKADMGVMLSASHNPMPDNGIKLFASGGHKLPDEVEMQIEQLITEQAPWQRPTGAAVGRVSDHLEGESSYADHLLVATPNPLDGLKVVVDCANGASSRVAPDVYRRAGADVVVIGANPDGTNINDGVGSTHLGPLQAAVVEHGADLGIAHDGDADRCLAVDASGTPIDGDQILAICAQALDEQDALSQRTVVATVMSNLGFHHAMEAAGISVRTTAVGDRYVLEELRRAELSLGGEQSGHVVFADIATTGDGLLTALHLMARMTDTHQSLAELGSAVTRLPQIMINVPVRDKDRVAAAKPVAEAVRRAEVELGGGGRILLRPSGTEQLVRVMVEAPSEGEAESVAQKVAAAVAAAK